MFDKRENRLLAALEPVDLSLLTPHLRTSYFAKGAILQEQEAPSLRSTSRSVAWWR
jgi:hypothetical protein